MYYIPAGIMAKGNKDWVDAAIKLGVTSEKLGHLNWGTFVSKLSTCDHRKYHRRRTICSRNLLVCLY